MSLIIYTDFKSPYAYLAKDLTYALEDDLGIVAEWRHFTLDIPSYLGSAEVDEAGRVISEQRSEHQWKKVRYAYMDVRRRANLRGLTIRGTRKIWDTSLAGAALYRAQAAGQGPLRSFMDIVFSRFWRRELDVEDPANLAACLGEAGADGEGFADYAAGEGAALHDRLRAEAWEVGVFGVPTFRIGDELFFGYEQLPMVRYRLTGDEAQRPRS